MVSPKVLMAGVCCMALAACSSDGSLSTGFDSSAQTFAAAPAARAADGSGGSAASASRFAANANGDTGAATGVTAAGSQGTAGPRGPAGAQGRAGAQGPAGARGPSGASGSVFGTGGILGAGLGLTGKPGMTTYLLGSDPAGNSVDKILGSNNEVSKLLGSSADSDRRALLPAITDAASGRSSVAILNPGLGLIGPGSATTFLLGKDAAGSLIGTNGPVTASLAGGKDSLLSPALGMTNLNTGLGQVLPTDRAVSAVNAIPQLGVLGSGGLVRDVLGTDVAGNLLGSQAPVSNALAGGQNGLLGKALDPAAPVVAAARTAVTNAISTAPVNALLNAGTPTNMASSAVASVESITAGLPGPSQTVGAVTGALPSGSASAGASGGLTAGVAAAAAPVTALLNTVTGALPTQGGNNIIAGTVNSVVQGTASGPLTGGLGSVLGGLR